MQSAESSDSIPTRIFKGLESDLSPIPPLLDYAAKVSSEPLLVISTYGDKNENFVRLYGLALGPTGLVVVSDWKQNKLIFFDKNMKFKSVIGSSSFFKRDECFGKPSGMASDKEGNIYIADRDNHCVKKFSILGKFVSKIGNGKAGSKNEELNSPRAVVISSQDVVYIADGLNHRIQVFQGDNYRFKLTIGSFGSGPSQLNVPDGVALNSTEEKLFVSDNKNDRIQVFNAEQGAFLHHIVHDEIQFPHGISCNKDNHLLICSSGKNCVLVCKEDGTLVANFKCIVNGERRFGIPGEAKVNSNGQIIIATQNCIVVL